MKILRTLAIALCAILLPLSSAIAQAPPVAGPTTHAFTGASQSNVWACTGGQSSFQLTVPSGLTGTFTVTVGQTSSTATSNPPWAYAPGSTVYANTITNSGSLTVNLGSNSYVKVADTAYTSGSVTITGSCSAAVAVIPPQPTPTPLPTAPALQGTNFTNLPLNQFSGLTAGNCVKANNSATTTLQTGAGTCAYANVSNTFTADQTFNSILYNQVNGVGSGLDHVFETKNLATSKPDSADALGGWYAYAPTINSGCSSGQPVSQLWPGIAGATSGNYGGYWVFATKKDGDCTIVEALVLTAGAHIYPAGPAIGAGSTSGCIGNDTQGICQITTASTCAAGVACGTVTVNFGIPFYQPDGTTTEQPYCTYAVQDTNLNANAWLAYPETLAYNAMTVGYAPLAAQSTARSLNITWQCNASSY